MHVLDVDLITSIPGVHLFYYAEHNAVIVHIPKLLKTNK